jgi:PAS domain S-box-containing protein
MFLLLLSLTTIVFSLAAMVLLYRLGSLLGGKRATSILALVPLLFAAYVALPLLSLTNEYATQSIWAIFVLLAISLVTAIGLVGLRRALLDNIHWRRTYEQMFNNIRDVYFTTDVNGIIEYLSPSAAQMLGSAVEEIIGTHIANLYAQDPKGTNNHNYFLTAMHVGGGSVLGYQASIQGNDGVNLPIEINANFRRTMGGKIVGIQGIFRDTSARIEAERMNAILGHVVEESFTEIYICDADTNKFISANKAARKNLGFSMTELRNLTPFDLVPALDETTYNIKKSQLFDGIQNAFTYESTHRRKDGSEYPVELTLQRIASGQSSVLFAHVQDLTERRSAEASLIKVENLRSVAQLTGGVAHEFNNMLQVMQLNVEMFETNQAEQNIYRAAALRAITRASKLTQQLRAFSKQQLLEPSNIDLNEILLAFGNELRLGLDATIDLKILPATELPTIYLDREQLENCLLNLSKNARLAMLSGGTLTLQSSLEILPAAATSNSAIDVAYVKLSISDTGSGMSQEVHDHAVEPFFTTRKIGQGAGLGLSMVHGFVIQSGGHMLITSSPDQGTRVDLHFPAAPPK